MRAAAAGHQDSGNDGAALQRLVTDTLQLRAQLPLGTKTVAMTARHFNGTLEYDAHNLYGLAQTRVTAEIMARAHGGRPFILTRRAPRPWPRCCA